MINNVQAPHPAAPRLKKAPTNPAQAVAILCAFALCGVLSSEEHRVFIQREADSAIQSAWRTMSHAGSFFGSGLKNTEGKKKTSPRKDASPQREAPAFEIKAPERGQPMKPEAKENPPQNPRPRVPFKPRDVMPPADLVYV